MTQYPSWCFSLLLLFAWFSFTWKSSPKSHDRSRTSKRKTTPAGKKWRKRRTPNVKWLRFSLSCCWCIRFVGYRISSCDTFTGEMYIHLFRTFHSGFGFWRRFSTLVCTPLARKTFERPWAGEKHQRNSFEIFYHLIVRKQQSNNINIAAENSRVSLNTGNPRRLFVWVPCA